MPQRLSAWSCTIVWFTAGFSATLAAVVRMAGGLTLLTMVTYTSAESVRPCSSATCTCTTQVRLWPSVSGSNSGRISLAVRRRARVGKRVKASSQDCCSMEKVRWESASGSVTGSSWPTAVLSGTGVEMEK